ncbi:MAG: response regulator [Gammaproteobacteria bacterium]|nr:response regulator [Gammaproteobacteria bacterium]
MEKAAHFISRMQEIKNVSALIEARSVMVVDDSVEDHEAFVRAFRRVGAKNEISPFLDCEKALESLGHSKSNPVEHERLPALIFVDLNMPGTDGREFLRRVKTDERLKCIPVIVLTTSVDDRDVNYCYSAGANAFIRKPVSLMDFYDMLDKTCRFWFDAANLPKC